MSSFRRWGLSALVLCLLVPPLSVRAADEAPSAADAKAGDALVYKTLRDVINEGADMYNAQGRYKNMDRDYAGCYHFYEGALMMAHPLLGRHADLQKAIDDAITSARETPQMEKRAFVLREVIDKIREEINPKGTGAAPMPPVVKETTTPPAAKEATVTGKVISGEKGKLTISILGQRKTINVPETAKVVINDKDGKLEDLFSENGATVDVTMKDDVVAKIVAHFEVKAPTPPPAAKETKASGKVISADKDKLAVMSVEGKETTFTIPKTAQILIDDKEAKLADVKPDSPVTVTSKGDDVVKIEVKAPAAPPAPPAAKTLWDRLGGEANVAKVVDDFVNTAGKDPKVNFWRDPTKEPSKEEKAALTKALVEFISSATGGPLKYEGKSMKEAHKGMKITNDEFDAAAKDLKDALEKHGAKAGDVEAVMTAVSGTRKDIVEAKEPEDKVKQDEKKSEEKKPAEAGHITGKVSYKGKPASGNSIGLIGKDFKYTAEIAADGTYHIKDDIKPGAYVVYVGENPDKPKADAVKVPAKYQDPEKSGLTVEVKKGEQTHDIDLQD